LLFLLVVVVDTASRDGQFNVQPNASANAGDGRGGSVVKRRSVVVDVVHEHE
jgi:hypothetical protein